MASHRLDSVPSDLSEPRTLIRTTTCRKASHDDLTALWARNNTATDGTTPAECIEVVGTRASVGSRSTERSLTRE